MRPFPGNLFSPVSIGNAPVTCVTEHSVVMVLFHGLVGGRTRPKLQYSDAVAAPSTAELKPIQRIAWFCPLTPRSPRRSNTGKRIPLAKA